MAQDSEFLIGFFGAAAIIVWVELEIRALGIDPPRERQNLKRISGFFLVSFVSYTIAAISEYAATHQQFPILYNNIWWLWVLEATTFIFGFFTLGTGAWCLRHYGERDARVPSYRGLFLVSVGALINITFLLLVTPQVTAVRQYGIIDWNGLVFLALLLLTFPAAFLAITGWERKGRRLWIIVLMVLLPWVFRLLWH